MFLVNYWKLLGVILSKGNDQIVRYNQNWVKYYSASDVIKNTSGTDVSNIITDMTNSNGTNYGTATVYIAYNKKLLSYWSFVCGDDDTEVSGREYSLGNDITSTFSNIQMTQNVYADEYGLHTLLTITGINNTGSNVTIREIGFTKPIYYVTDTSSSSNTAYSTNVLLFRKVLDNPVVVANNGGVFNINVEINNR